jgi:hypothetical protein
LSVAKNNGVNGLTPAEIEFILKKRLMVKGIHRSNVRRDLRNSTTLVERFPIENGNAYRITSYGEEQLEKVLNSLDAHGETG